MEGPAVRVSVWWLETEFLRRVAAALKARDDEEEEGEEEEGEEEEEEVKDYKEVVAFHSPPQS